MIKIKAVAIASFTHGSLSLKRGDEAEFTEPTFVALAAHALVREADAKPAAVAQTRNVRAARPPSNKKAPPPLNKSVGNADPVVTEGAPGVTEQSGSEAERDGESGEGSDVADEPAADSSSEGAADASANSATDD